MDNAGTYLVPDFYRTFQCKCGECRISCCEGWDVGVSQDEYFRLIGLDTTDALRARIQRGFYIPKDATPERYAVLNHDWLGRCPMRSEDGLCALQTEMGESVLPSICRLFPRSIREDLGEATLSNSCERIIELLIERPNPIRFETTVLPKAVTGSELPDRMALRMQCIGLLQDRSSTFKESISAVGGLICGGLGNETAPFAERLDVMRSFLKLYAEISPSLTEYCENALLAFQDIDETGFRRRYDTLCIMFPDFNLTQENMMVNHFFYEKFPYSETREDEAEEFVSLCGLIGFLDVITAGNVERIGSRDDMVDLLSHSFRMIEHTSFHYNAHILLKEHGYDDPSKALTLTHLYD